MNAQKSASFMALAIEQVMHKNNRRFLRSWSSFSRKPKTANAPSSATGIQRPRHFASKTNPLKKASNTTTTTATATNNLFQSFVTQERDAKILFGLVPTLLFVGFVSFLDKWNVLPLATILAGFGLLGQEKMRLERDGKFVEVSHDDKNEEVPRLLHQSSTSSLSTTSESTIASIDYADKNMAMEGIEVPVGCTVNGIYLDRHGSGLRCFAFFRGIAMRVYVATLYASKPLVDEQDVFSHNDAPLQMDFTFLRGFTSGQCRLAWQKQLDESVSYRYDGLEQDKQDFLDKIATQSLKANGTVTVQILDDKTLIFDQGTFTGEIIGKDFQRAFLSMWFGDKPVTTELKANLLGRES